MDPTRGLEADAAACDFGELWLSDREHGVVRPLAEYLARFPGHETRIAREYLALTEPAAVEAEPHSGSPEEVVGPYRMLRLLGQGGQGTVWLAEDKRLGRLVALKVLDTVGSAFSAARISRLRREAQALARLEHPGICAIYEADLEGTRPYLAMRYVEGETLSHLLTEAREGRSALLPARTKDQTAPWLHFFAQAAEALHAAHELGIVHRDVKPGNLIRTREGAPVVLDFGLARDMESTALSLTQSGELFGTLPYMAPEMLLGRGIDRRVDVYALGVTLYETLALRRPFEAATHEALRRQIESGEARSISELVPSLGTELGTVLATAIERDPARRYASALAFAEDLRRLQRGDPIAARPLALGVRLRRIVARHPVLAASVVILTIALAVALWLLAQVSRGRAQLTALREAYVALSVSEDNPSKALDIATEAGLREKHAEINEILVRVLDRYWEHRNCAYIPEAPIGYAHLAPWVETDPESRFVLCGSGDGVLNRYDLATGKLLPPFRSSIVGMIHAALAPDGQHAIYGTGDGSVGLVRLSKGEVLWQRKVHERSSGSREGVTRVVFAPDGRHAVTCGDDGLVVVHDVFGTDPPIRCVGHAGAVARAVFDASGRFVMTAGDVSPTTSRGDLTVRIFATATGAEVRRFGPFPVAVHWEAFSADGTRVALAHDDGRACVYSVDDGREIAGFRHGGQVNWLAFAAEESQLVTGSPDGLSVWDVASGARIVRRPDFHDRSVYRGAFSPDRKRLAVVAWDDSGRIYDTQTWECQRVFRGIVTRPRGLCWDARGDLVITVGAILQSWYATERPFLPSLEGHKDRVLSARYSEDGKKVLTASADRSARIFDASTGRCLRALEHDRPLRAASFSRDATKVVTCPDGAPPRLFIAQQEPLVLGNVGATDAWFFGDDQIVACGDDGTVRLFDAKTGALCHAFPGHSGPLVCARFHPTRPWLATGGNDRRVGLWDLARRVPIFLTEPWVPGPLGERERVFDLAFDTKGDRLAASCEDTALRVWDLSKSHEPRVVKVTFTFGKLAFFETSNEMLFAAQWSGIVRILDLGDMESVRPTSTQHSNLVTRMAFSPDRKLVMTASRDGTVSLFDPEHGVIQNVIRASSVAIIDACFSPDGASVLTATTDGSVRIWPVDPLPIADRYRQRRWNPQTMKW